MDINKLQKKWCQEGLHAPHEVYVTGWRDFEYNDPIVFCVDKSEDTFKITEFGPVDEDSVFDTKEEAEKNLANKYAQKIQDSPYVDSISRHLDPETYRVDFCEDEEFDCFGYDADTMVKYETEENTLARDISEALLKNKDFNNNPDPKDKVSLCMRSMYICMKRIDDALKEEGIHGYVRGEIIEEYECIFGDYLLSDDGGKDGQACSH
jgi:hypothetical protein